MKNFGKLLPLDEAYKLYDFKSMLLFRLHNFGMNISDISVYMHHKNISTTEKHLLSRNLIYNQEFRPPQFNPNSIFSPSINEHHLHSIYNRYTIHYSIEIQSRKI
jgi:hypothetical protein